MVDYCAAFNILCIFMASLRVDPFTLKYNVCMVLKHLSQSMLVLHIPKLANSMESCQLTSHEQCLREIIAASCMPPERMSIDLHVAIVCACARAQAVS